MQFLLEPVVFFCVLNLVSSAFGALGFQTMCVPGSKAWRRRASWLSAFVALSSLAAPFVVEHALRTFFPLSVDSYATSKHYATTDVWDEVDAY